MKSVVCIVLLISASFLHAQTETVSQNQMIDNLTAFTKLYGYVRFFHPSDEAAAVDWNKLAVFGVQKVRNAKNTNELKQALNEIFLPVAPTMQLLLKNEKPVPLKQYDDTTNLKPVAWQYHGVQLDQSNIYRSTRVGRSELKAVSGNGAYQEIEEERPYKGKHFRITAYLNAEITAPNCGILSFGAYGNGNKINIEEKLIASTNGNWSPLVLKGRFQGNPNYMSYSIELVGNGVVWADEVTFEISDDSLQWTPVVIPNPGFEDVNDKQEPRQWSLGGDDYQYTADKEIKKEGQYSLRIKSKPGIIPGKLFPSMPVYGEVIHKPLNKTLSVFMPLALYADSSGTLPHSDTAQFRLWHQAVNSVTIDSFNTKEINTKLAAVTVLWNILQNFYPYHDVVKTDWKQELPGFIKMVLTDSAASFTLQLHRMLHTLPDGHMSVFQMRKPFRPYYLFPIMTDLIENQLVIIRSADTANFRAGDIIRKINGEDALSFYKRHENYPSGALQYRRASLKSRLFTYETDGDSVNLILERDQKLLPVTMKRNLGRYMGDVPETRIKKINDSIMYVNLNVVPMKEIDSIMSELADAKGLIFDLRAYPNGNHDLLKHMTDTMIHSARWNVPQTIYPDRENIASYDTSGRWSMQPLKPRLNGKAVFIISGHAISYAESFLGIVEHYKLGELVGETTAGTNGNVNSIWLPGGCRVWWTGMKVLKHDGSQHHLVGIKPTVPVKRTIKAVKEGRDEYLEKAIEILTKKK